MVVLLSSLSSSFLAKLNKGPLQFLLPRDLSDHDRPVGRPARLVTLRYMGEDTRDSEETLVERPHRGAARFAMSNTNKTNDLEPRRSYGIGGAGNIRQFPVVFLSIIRSNL